MGRAELSMGRGFGRALLLHAGLASSEPAWRTHDRAEPYAERSTTLRVEHNASVSSRSPGGDPRVSDPQMFLVCNVLNGNSKLT